MAALPLLPGGLAVDAEFNPPPGYWLGLQVVWKPLGPQWNQLDASSWDSLSAALRWNDIALATFSGIQIYAPPGVAQRVNQVFAGRVTDLYASYDNSVDSVILQVHAEDDTADLANRNITQTSPCIRRRVT